MTEIEKIQSKILMRMQEILSNEQLQKLENVLVLEFHNIEVKQECTDLVTSERHWEKILRTFLASKRIDCCSQYYCDRRIIYIVYTCRNNLRTLTI